MSGSDDEGGESGTAAFEAVWADEGKAGRVAGRESAEVSCNQEDDGPRVALFPALWFNRRMGKKTSGYRGMMQKLEGTVGLYAQRDIRDYAQREVNLYARKGTITDVEKLQRKYQLSGLDAKRLHNSVKRRLVKLRRDAAGVEVKKRTRTSETVAPVRALEPVAVAEGLLVEALEAIRGLAGEELLIKGEQTAIAEGFVYLLTHEMHPGWVKAGMTIDYEMRLAVYNTSDPLCRFEFKALRPVPERRRAERDLLGKLGSKADEQRGEWFKMSVDEALEVFGASWL